MSKIVLQKNKPIILSIGGSLIVPSGSPDVMFLKALKKFVDAQIKIGNKRFGGIINEIGMTRNMLKKGGIIDKRRVYVTIINDWQKGKLLLNYRCC